MKCPGQDSRYWKPGSIFEAKCPKCNEPVEFFKDDPTRKCGKCGHKFVNPNMDFGCAAYCKFADQCIGELPPELLAEREGLMKDRIAVEMKKYFNKDFKRIGRATRTARHAEAIAAGAGGDPAVIMAAAYLHNIGYPEAIRKHGAADKKQLEAEGAAVARQIMETIGAKEEMIEEVCDIISRHYHPRGDETPNFKAVWDAGRIAELEEEARDDRIGRDQIKETIETQLFTQSAKQRAAELLLQHDQGAEA